MINSITLNGNPIALTAVDYDITIAHGRNSVYDTSAPSNARYP
jgi:hypothetical protein